MIPATYVTREMALDAGDPSLEGTVYEPEHEEEVECPVCAGGPSVLTLNLPGFDGE